MAPPVGRRSKQNSPAPPPLSLPLPGIALGLFAAIAAGLAASRALRRKKLPRSLEGEKPSISASDSTPILDGQLLQEGREIDSDTSSAFVVNGKGTITIAQEHPKLAAGLKPVFEALEEASVQTRDIAIKPLQEENGNKEEGTGCGDGKREEEAPGGKYEENDKKTGETLENGNSGVDEGQVADITLGFEASLTLNGESVAALQGKTGKEEGEKYEKESGRGYTDREVQATDICRDAGHDIDDEETYSDSQPSPILINGRGLDLFEELPDFKEDPDRFSGCYSDAISESSLQELTSAPVKPFVPTEEYMEVSLPLSNSDPFSSMSQQGDKKAFAGDELGCDHEGEEGISELEEGLFQTDETPVRSKHDWLISNEDSDSCVVGMKGKKPLVEEVKFEMVADVSGEKIKENSLAPLEGKISSAGTVDEGLAGTTRINGKILRNDQLLPKEVDSSEGSGEGKPVLQSTEEINASVGKCGDFTQSMRINGLESSDKNTHASSEGDLNDGDEPLQEACFGMDASGMGAVKASVPDFTEQNPDAIETFRAEDEVSLHDKQSSPMAAQKEVSEGITTSRDEESMDSWIVGSGSEAGIGDGGLKEEIEVEEITHEKEEEIGEMGSYDARDLDLQSKKLASSKGAAHMPGNNDSEKGVGSSVSKGAVHFQDLQQKGAFWRKVLQYLPRELGFFCVLVALMSFILWHLKVSTPLQQW